jgi:hypothetical protein
MAGEKVYVSREVYLTELLDKTWPSELEGFSFTSCRIYGPMVVLQLGNVTFVNVRFNARDVDEMFFEVPAGTAKVGVVGLRNCTFADCEIDGVAFVGTREVRDQIRQALG